MLAAMGRGGNPLVASAAGQHEAGNYEETSDGQDGDRAKDCSSYGGNKGPLHTPMRSLDQSFELGIACGVRSCCMIFTVTVDHFPSIAVLFYHGHGNLPSGQSSTIIRITATATKVSATAATVCRFTTQPLNTAAAAPAPAAWRCWRDAPLVKLVTRGRCCSRPNSFRATTVQARQCGSSARGSPRMDCRGAVRPVVCRWRASLWPLGY